MAVSFYSPLGFNSTLQAKYQSVSRFSAGASTPAVTQFTSLSGKFGPRRHVNRRGWGLCFCVTDSNQLTTETDDKASETSSTSPSEDPLPAVSSSSLGSSANNSQFQTSAIDQPSSQTSEASNGSSVTSGQKQEESSPPTNSQVKSKRLPLTARERLRAAKVLSRYNTESKPARKKSDRSKTVLDAARASEGGKGRSGLPQAPTNIFDDSKRGMPKDGLTWDFPGGADLFLIIFSFVFISTVMFATTYFVWKVGAIHFNEN
ncbi:uncharacterized protein LOC126802860 [Argentina anserina]|uniref:uncharacterized protein LOC126802860 n=1 Tax=Argentina anserina TaxID=57926 RepID=UPI0021766EE6|nr:uncharacterized protein LOC126802860 [Potentilla anserina]